MLGELLMIGMLFGCQSPREPSWKEKLVYRTVGCGCVVGLVAVFCLAAIGAWTVISFCL